MYTLDYTTLMSRTSSDTKALLIESLRGIICATDKSDNEFAELDMTGIIKTLTLHLESEYMPKSPNSINPLSNIKSSCYENVKGGSGRKSDYNMLETLVDALNSRDASKKSCSGGSTAVVNIKDNTITPRTFQRKNGTCHLTMVVNKNKDGVYHPFDNKTYFPRFTLDDDPENPQMHSLCFFVVHDEIKKAWKVVTLQYSETNLYANYITGKNAYALVYIGQDFTKEIFDVDMFIGAFTYYNTHLDQRNKPLVIDSETFKKLIHPQLLMNYYYNNGDAILRNVYDSVRDALRITIDAISTNHNLTDIIRFFFLHGYHESRQENNERLLFQISSDSNYFYEKIVTFWTRDNNNITRTLMKNKDFMDSIIDLSTKTIDIIKTQVINETHELWVNFGKHPNYEVMVQNSWKEIYYNLWTVVYDICPKEPLLCAKLKFKNVYDALCANLEPMRSDLEIKSFQIGIPTKFDEDITTLKYVIPVNPYNEKQTIIVFGIENMQYKDKSKVYGVNIGSGAKTNTVLTLT